MNTNPTYWKMRNGKSIDIDSMDLNHLRNTLKMIVNNSNKHKEQKKLHGWNDAGANEFNNSAIGRKFKELEVQELMDDYEDICGYDNDL